MQLAADEATRLAECSIEPILIPGAIQPHGALVTVEPNSLEILQVSANSKQMLGIDPLDLVGQSVSVILTGDWLTSTLATEGDRLANPYFTEVNGINFDLIIHRTSELIILEFEPSSPKDMRLFPDLSAAIRRISTVRETQDLRNCVARELREWIGFDRVVVYKFHPDGHGEVVAEDRLLELEPYLHQHFPASDIPAQARALYLKKASQLIVNSTYTPVPLIPVLNPTTGKPLDLSQAEMRSVSPHHLQYMRNMGNAASISLPLVREGQLVGMVTATDREPRMVSYLVRRACEIIADHLTLQTGALNQIHLLKRQLDYQLIRSDLVRQIVDAHDISSGLCSGDITLLNLVNCDGAIVRIDGKMTSIGIVPSDHEKFELFRWIAKIQEPMEISSDALGSEYPTLAKLVPDFAGIQIWQCGPRGDFLAFFRAEVLDTIDWIGDPRSINRDTPLSPRNSFSIWRQSVTGKSLPWLAEETHQIRELIRDLNGVRAHQAAAADLSRAGEVQRALNPKESVPGLGFDVAGACLPTSTVGGDFYDWYSIEGGIAITLVDVMGKGVGAGMIAAAVRTSLRIERNNPDSSVAVSKTSSMLSADLAEVASFATLFHARLNSNSGKISFTDAGHGLSLIVRHDGSFVHLKSTNFPIGLSLKEDFSEQFEELLLGDMLISFSDGVLDLHDSPLEAMEFITELARNSPNPQSLVDAMMNEVANLAMSDDITILAVKRNNDRP